MRILFLVLVMAGLAFFSLGPGQTQVDSLQWFLFNAEPPTVAVSGPTAPVRGQARFQVRVEPQKRASLEAAWIDGVPIEPGDEMVVDTARLADGAHTLVVQARDHSRLRNEAQTSLAFTSDNTAPHIEVRLEPGEARDGRTVALRAGLSEPGTLSAQVDGRPLTLHRQDQEWWTVIGFPPEPGPREVELRLEAADEAGNAAERLERLPVLRGSFEQEHLLVPEAMARLLGPDARAREQARLAPLYERQGGPPLWRGRFLTPSEGPVTTSYGARRAYNEVPGEVHHAGLDIAAPLGAPVAAANDGRVVFVGELELRGTTLVIDHGAGVFTTYAHLEEVLAKEGQVVRKGEQVAAVGSTGLSTGPHLHWELWVGGANVDPAEWTEREFP